MNHLFRDMQKVRRLARAERRAGLRTACEGARHDPFRGKQQHRLRMALRVPILSCWWAGIVTWCSVPYTTERRAHVASCRANEFVANFSKPFRRFFPAGIPRKLQAEMTFSLTQCKRMTEGFPPTSKWQLTAVAHHLPEVFERFGLRENGIPQGAGFIAALGRFLDGTDDFFFKHSVTSLMDYNPRAEI